MSKAEKLLAKGRSLESKGKREKALDGLAAASPSARERISAHAMRGDPRWTILEHAAGANDLIVLSRRSIGAVERFLVGSVAAHIIERAACDVLVVPPEAA